MMRFSNLIMSHLDHSESIQCRLRIRFPTERNLYKGSRKHPAVKLHLTHLNGTHEEQVDHRTY